MLQPDLYHALKQAIGAQHVLQGRTATEVYSYDASLVTGQPDAILLPGDTAEVSTVVKALAASRVPFVPRGFGTNLSGGSVSLEGGVVICLSRLNQILDISVRDRCALVQPGVTNLELQQALAPLGYFYAPDPASQKVATLGGNIGENSGGPHCLKYGVTGNHVLGMAVVLPDGEVAMLGDAAAGSEGMDLRGIMIGSEGTLGIVTEAIVRILPQPQSVVTLLVIYDDVAAAAQSVSDIIAAGIVPATLEMMDAPVMQAVEDSVPCGYPRDAAAVLIAEVDGPAVGLRKQAEDIAAICAHNGCRSVREAKDDAERDRLWAGRRGAFGAIARITPNYLVTDCTVPRSKLPEALAGVTRVAGEYGLASGNVFHAGDGNLHPLLFFDSRDEGQLEQVHRAGWEIMQVCVDLGGTISGEHGIGVEKRDAMRMVFSEDDLEFQRRVKRAFDPENLLNPGKIVPPPGAAVPPPEPAATAVAAGMELTPRDAAEACRLVRRAISDRVPLVPLGCGSGIDTTRLPGNAALVRTAKLNGLVDFDHVNQVVTVGAGMPLANLQETLAAQGQWLPLRPLAGDCCTVGGMAALGACGPDRLRYGSPRDWLLGLKFVCPDGRLVSAGGRVVKNVTGYDVTRLLAGSAGALGLITELTFRTMPLPKMCHTVSAGGPKQQCEAAAASLLDSKLEPVFLLAVPATTAPDVDGAWRFEAGFEGFADTVAWQTEEALARMRAAGLQDTEIEEYEPHSAPFRRLQAALFRQSFLARASVPLGRLTQLHDAIGTIMPNGRMALDFGRGQLLAGASALPAESWLSLCRCTADLGGCTALERGFVDTALEGPTPASPHSATGLQARIKAALDPQNVFVAGRNPGGLSV